ncbi:MAG TPA: hypothetical protein VFF04_00820 [Candidatus Babeliales bacterium]|nr:hypothetical protein [Candidatus Babeliales bacterium]
MNRLFTMIICTILIPAHIHADQKDNAMHIGQRYIALLQSLSTFNTEKFNDDCVALFSPTIKKVINSKIVCTNRKELMDQMLSIVQTYGIKNVDQLELIRDNDDTLTIIRFEITFNDNTTECVISIIKADRTGLIEEINEVFGEKEAYQWTP